MRIANNELTEITTHRITPKAIGLIPADLTRSLDKLVPIKNKVNTNSARDTLDILRESDSGKEV